MTREERAVRAAEKAALKAGKRRLNKENWLFHPANANAAWIERQIELITAIAPEIKPIDEDRSSASLSTMRSIMADTSTPLYRRIAAAEVVLGFELGAGSVSGVDPEQIAAGSYHFLRAVSESAATPEALKFKALRLIVAVENTRQAATSSPAQHHAHREFHRRLTNAARAEALRAAGVWERAIASGAAWALGPRDIFDLPASLPLPDVGCKIEDGVAEHLDAVNRWRQSKPEEAARYDAERTQVLLSIRASNRPDEWELLLAR